MWRAALMYAAGKLQHQTPGASRAAGDTSSLPAILDQTGVRYGWLMLVSCFCDGVNALLLSFGRGPLCCTGPARRYGGAGCV